MLHYTHYGHQQNGRRNKRQHRRERELRMDPPLGTYTFGAQTNGEYSSHHSRDQQQYSPNGLLMVCVPCIFLPILLAIYLKFIQPFIFRLLPERWVTFLDTILYPTCPAKVPQAAENSSCKCCEAEECESLGKAKAEENKKEL